jgi:hypothetical protein
LNDGDVVDGNEAIQRESGSPSLECSATCNRCKDQRHAMLRQLAAWL